MKKIFALTFVAVFFMAHGLLHAAEHVSLPKRPMSPELTAEMEFYKKVGEFYKTDAAYHKEKWGQKSQLAKQLAELRAQKNSSKDEKKKKESQDQIAALSKQADDLSEEIAKHDIESAEFGVTVAQHHLENTKKALQRIQERKANTPK